MGNLIGYDKMGGKWQRVSFARGGDYAISTVTNKSMINRLNASRKKNKWGYTVPAPAKRATTKRKLPTRRATPKKKSITGGFLKDVKNFWS